MWERGMPGPLVFLDVLVRHHHHVDEQEREQHRAPQREDREAFAQVKQRHAGKKRSTSISVMSRISTTSFAGRVSSSFCQADSAGLVGNLEASMRVVHQITASTHLAKAAASTASLKACGVRLHWLMMKLKTTTILEYIGFSPFLKRPCPDGRPARPFRIAHSNFWAPV